MSFGGGQGEECVKAAIGHQVLIGDVFVAPVKQSVRIDRVEVVGRTSGFTVEAISLVDVDHGGAIDSSVYPPPATKQWSERISPSGASVPAKGVRNVVVQVKRTGTDAAAAGITIFYSTAGGRYEKQNTTSYVLRSTCS